MCQPSLYMLITPLILAVLGILIGYLVGQRPYRAPPVRYRGQYRETPPISMKGKPPRRP